MTVWSDIMGMGAQHDKGRWFDMPHPATGSPTGLEFLVAGPDGRIARHAQWALLDGLATAQTDAAPIPAETRERLRLDALGAHLLAWRGEGLPAFSGYEARQALGASGYLVAFIDAAVGSALHNMPDPDRGPAGTDALEAMAAAIAAGGAA